MYSELPSKDTAPTALSMNTKVNCAPESPVIGMVFDQVGGRKCIKGCSVIMEAVRPPREVGPLETETSGMSSFLTNLYGLRLLRVWK